MARLFIGLMSGTSLDGVDAVVTDLSSPNAPQCLGHAHQPYPDELKQALLDLRGLSSLTDYYLICTCQNEAQMRAALGAAQRALSREGVKALRSEYMPGVRWAVLDYGEFIIHIFEKQTRNYYSLERLWGDAKSMYLKAEDYALPDSGAAADGSADDDL